MDINKIFKLTTEYKRIPTEEIYLAIRDELLPLFIKYSRKLYNLDQEDCFQEFSLTLFEALTCISQTESPFAVFKYLYISIHNKYVYLCKKLHSGLYFESYEDIEWKLDAQSDGHLSDIEFTHDLQNILHLPLRQKQILFLLLLGNSTTEIGNILGISKQYVSRIKKELQHYLRS